MLAQALADALSAPRFRSKAAGSEPRRQGQATAEKTQYALGELVRLLAPADVLEIGTFFADTAHFVAGAMERIGGGHITTIDPFGGHRVPGIIATWAESFRNRVTFRPDNSMTYFLYLDEELHVRRGIEAPFNIIFVDGHHAFDYAFFDLIRSSLFLRPGGAIVVDNIELAGPAAAIRAFLERHTHWHLFRAAEANPKSLAFHSEANSAIILAPDGLEVGNLPHQIDLFNLKSSEIRELRIDIRCPAPGVLRVVTLLYCRPADYANTGVGEQICLSNLQHQVRSNEEGPISLKYNPPLTVLPNPGDRVAVQLELSFVPAQRENLLLEASPITLV